MELNYNIEKEDISKNIVNVIKKKLFVSTTLIKKLKIVNGIHVNDKPVFANYILKENDVITIHLDKLNNIGTKFKDKFKLNHEIKLDILYEDEYLLIVNKPAFMPVHPSTNEYYNTLSNIVAAYLEKQNIYSIHIITRLDKNTSGICVFSKNEYIQELFTRKKNIINFKKEYIAIADGIITKDQFIIEKNIARKPNSIIIREVNENGDYAKTECFVLNRNYDKNYTIVKVLLHTGRTHQIRVHLASIGHILLGDDLYATEYNVKNISRYINRQALHSEGISFIHPITNNLITIHCDLLEDMKKLIY